MKRLAAWLLGAWLLPACAQLDLRFEVDLEAEIAAGRFDPAHDGVELRGGFAPLRWDQGLALAPAGPGRWQVTVHFARRPAGDQPVPHKFRLLRAGQGGSEGWEPGRNRLAALDGGPVGRRFGAPPAEVVPSLSGQVVALPALRSRHVAPREVLVWLPPGYDDDPARRHPVLYLHDGQTVFDARAAGVEWRVDETAGRLVRDGRIAAPIIVAVPSDRQRLHELTPSEGGRGGGGLAAYTRFLLDELKPEIDRRFRTRPEAAATAVGGASLGGLASLWIALHEPARVGAALVVSPSLWWDGQRALRELRRLGPLPAPPRLWLDIGTGEGEEAVQQTRALRDALQARGWAGTKLAYVEDPDGVHDELSWAGRVEAMLKFLYPLTERTPR